ncbi:hypothetical protein PSTG_18862, partial [Puccinia striiformis f. sp. tritici PST-78]
MQYYLNDIIVIAIGMLFIAFFIRAWGDMHIGFNEKNTPAMSLDAWNLFYYSLRTSMRFIIGMAWSLLFSIVFAVLAARYVPLRWVILPFVNFMDVMGLECTAIFA